MRYVVRKRDQKWLVCAESGLLEFEDFQEAFLVARNAAHVLNLRAAIQNGRGA